MYQVANRHLEAQATLVMIGKVTSPEIPAFLGNVYRQVAETIGRSDVDFAGPPFARMRLIDETDASFEIEAGFPDRSDRRRPGLKSDERKEDGQSHQLEQLHGRVGNTSEAGGLRT